MSTPSSHAVQAPASPTAGSTSAAATNTQSVPHIRIVPHLDAPRSLHFDVVDKDVPEGFVLKIGRFTDKQNLPNRVTFKSKVVSRGHAEIFSENGKFFIRDTKSSSGTFLNHARLSPPGVESKPTPLKDGDVIQLGVDYQGGTQEIYRCVKMRLELNRSWQQKSNPFRENTLKTIRSLTTASAACATDCCICLFRIASFQSLFVAPCSHVYHYKCIRPMLIANHPGFLCPLCRTFADLEDTVEIDDPIEEPTPLQNAAVVEQEVAEPDSTGEVISAEAATSQQEQTPAEPATIEEISTPTQPEWTQSELPAHDEVEAGTPIPSSPTPNAASSPRPASASSSSSGSSGQQSSASATVPPMDIAGSGSSMPLDSPIQQSPSAAFLMAPSPPMFVSSFGLSPIPFVAPAPANSSSAQNSSSPPSQRAEHHSSSSPSSPSSVGHMFQNFVRNITIPHRNRSRTNSNSATSPVIANSTHGHSAAASQGRAAATGTAVAGERVPADVFGKTLVMTPPTLLRGVGELGVVSETEGDTEPSQDASGHGSSSRGGSGSSSSRSSSQSREAHRHEDSSSADNLAMHNAQTIAAGAHV